MIDYLVEKLKQGEVMALPTDTVDGLVCNAYDLRACERIYERKKRPKEKPLCIFIKSIDELDKYADTTGIDKENLKKYWPGKYTLIFKKKDNALDHILSGGDTIGIRIPNDERILAILNRVDFPLAETSNNISGEPIVGTPSTIISLVDDNKVFRGKSEVSDKSKVGVKTERNIKVELIRMIAVFAVIWYHIRALPWLVDGSLSETAVFFETLCSICVITFFFLTGFYIYDRNDNIFKDWFKLIKKTFTNVFIPFLITSAICITFHDFFISSRTFVECIKDFSITHIFTEIINSLKIFDIVVLPGTAGHLWFVYSYMKIIIVYPITRFMLRKFPRIIVYLILLTLTIFMVLNDYYVYYGNPRFNLIFDIVHKPIYYSAWAYVLYHDILLKFKGIKSIILGLIIYIISFVGLLNTQIGYYLGYNGEYVYTSWLSTYSLFLTTGFVIFMYNLPIDKYLVGKTAAFIKFVSKHSFMIYLVHYLVITKFLTLGLPQMIVKNRPTIFHHFLYYIIYGTFIFIVSLIVVLIIDFIKGGIYGNWKKKRLS